MEAINEALKLISQARTLLEQTDFTDSRDNLPEAALQVELLLEKAVEVLTK